MLFNNDIIRVPIGKSHHPAAIFKTPPGSLNKWGENQHFHLSLGHKDLHV